MALRMLSGEDALTMHSVPKIEVLERSECNCCSRASNTLAADD